MESEEEEDSAVAFKKAGSEASEPDVAKFKVFITQFTKELFQMIYNSLQTCCTHMLHYRRLLLMAKMVVKVNLIGAVIQTVRVQAVMMKANIKIFVNVSLKSMFS